jgi:hypothetical protein
LGFGSGLDTARVHILWILNSNLNIEFGLTKLKKSKEHKETKEFMELKDTREPMKSKDVSSVRLRPEPHT